jgi:hypothetical protein
VPGTRYKVQGTRYKVQGTRYKARPYLEPESLHLEPTLYTFSHSKEEMLRLAESKWMPMR